MFDFQYRSKKYILIEKIFKKKIQKTHISLCLTRRKKITEGNIR